MSPGKATLLYGADGKKIIGSISEKIYLTINGAKQGMFIRGKSLSNPVLLYIHGGMPDYFLNLIYPSGLEDYFTVVWWEQRGSGISYDPKADSGLVTSEQLNNDAVVLINYLRNRFGKSKVFLMAHSGGTFTAARLASQRPDLFYAYIAVAQITDQAHSESISYDYMLHSFEKMGSKKFAGKLKRSPVVSDRDISAGYYKIRDIAMHSLGVGTMHSMKSVITGLFFPSLLCRDYTLAEKLRFWRAKAGSGVSTIWQEITNTDISWQIKEFQVPVYFFHGIYDYTVSYSLAESYFKSIKAPVKRFYTFDKSAHSPHFEEPDKMRKIIEGEILKNYDTD
jgi:pimeloyl-ACP methyl ester carboxylesterase